MNYAKISAIVTILGSLIGGTWWFASNVVMASDFQQYQTQQEVRWLQQDKRSAWQEYIGLRQLHKKTERDDTRILELEQEVKDINSKIKSLRD